MSLRSFASGHLYSAISLPSFLSCLSCRRLVRGPHLGKRGLQADVGSAAAKISTQTAMYLLARRAGMFVQDRLAGDNKTRSTEPALLPVVVYNRLLNGE